MINRKSKIENQKLLLCVLCVWSVSLPAQAGLVGDAAQFLEAHDSLSALLAQIDRERAGLPADIGVVTAIHQDALAYFSSRNEALAARVAKQAALEPLQEDLGLPRFALASPARGRRGLAQDAASYIANYDAWVALQQQVELDVEALHTALAQGDFAGLESAIRILFADLRARLQKRLQWQQDFLFMKRDSKFKGSGKPRPPGRGTLGARIQRFLADREKWESYGQLVEIDRSNLRAAVVAQLAKLRKDEPDAGNSLDSVVNSLLADCHSRYLMGLQLGFDLTPLGADLAMSNTGLKAIRPGTLFTGRDMAKDEESDSLEETADAVGAQ